MREWLLQSNILLNYNEVHFSIEILFFEMLWNQNAWSRNHKMPQMYPIEKNNLNENKNEMKTMVPMICLFL